MTVCMDDIVSSFLEGSRKVVYLGYRRFLVEGHRYWSKKFYNLFDSKSELHSALVKRDGHYVFEMVRTILVTYGETTKDGKKRNIDKAPIDGYHLRNSPSSISTCRIGRILRSAMQSMVCT
jgi:hypothetical protein